MSAHAIHHVTAVTAQVGENLRFYTQVLGFRLVKRSVNQDDVNAYHLFYADGVGSPGTDMTFFDWPDAGQSVPGAATVALTSFRAPNASLDWWLTRLDAAGTSPTREGNSILFSDPEGQRLELVGQDEPNRHAKPWASVVGEGNALLGILGVDLQTARPEGTGRVLKEILGYRGGDDGLYFTDGDGWNARVRIVQDAVPRFGRVGAGGVHHVAFRVKDEAELLEMQEKVRAFGLQTSGEIDRFYFQSVYFREPGGILFELATDGPGFSSDESQATLGERLALPPFLEGRRHEIEAGLKPLPVLA